MTALAVDGVDQLRESIADLVGWLEDPVDLELEAAQVIADRIDPPVLTGRLASTVRAEQEASGAVVLAGGPGASYGAIVNARAHFMQEGLADAEADVLQVAIDHLQNHVDNLKGA